MNLLLSLDHSLFYLINRNGQNPVFDVVMPIISTLKFFYIPIALAWLAMMIRGRMKTRVVAVVILLLIGCSESISSHVLKPVFNRPRPYHQLSHVHEFNKMTRSWRITPELKAPVVGRSQSFPSSHAANIFAAAFFLSYFFRRFWPFFYLIAVLVGYSRVYLGVHFPLDVAGGALVGTACAYVFAKLTTVAVDFFKPGGGPDGTIPDAPPASPRQPQA